MTDETPCRQLTPLPVVHVPTYQDYIQADAQIKEMTLKNTRLSLAEQNMRERLAKRKKRKETL